MAHGLGGFGAGPQYGCRQVGRGAMAQTAEQDPGAERDRPSGCPGGRARVRAGGNRQGPDGAHRPRGGGIYI